MGERYEQLKEDLSFIVEEIKQFEDNPTIRDKAFDFLASGLLSQKAIPTIHPSMLNESIAPNSADHLVTDTSAEVTTDSLEGADFINFTERHQLILQELTAKNFAVVIAYYYAQIAPESEQLEEINSIFLERAFVDADRKPPASANNVLNAAEKERYLQKSGKSRSGHFKITAKGEHFAKNILRSEITSND